LIVVEKVQFDEQIPVANNGDACSHEERLNTIQPLANRSRFLRLLTLGSLDVEPLTHASSTPTLEDIFVPEGASLGTLNPWRRMGLSIRNNLRYWGNKILALEGKAHGQTAWEMFLPPTPNFSQSDNWRLLEAANLVRLLQFDTTTASAAFIPIPQINYGKPASITNVQVLLRGTGHSALPATMPTISLVGYDSDFTADVLATASDPSANAAAYDVQHYVNIPGLTPLLIGTYPMLALKLTGEADSPAAGGLTCLGVRVTITPS
jgi:hypothetical protein